MTRSIEFLAAGLVAVVVTVAYVALVSARGETLGGLVAPSTVVAAFAVVTLWVIQPWASRRRLFLYGLAAFAALVILLRLNVSYLA
jgi:hypothetical protein